MPVNPDGNPEFGALNRLLRGILQGADQPLFVSFIILTLSTVGATLIGLLLIASTSLTVISVQRLTGQLITLAAITPYWLHYVIILFEGPCHVLGACVRFPFYWRPHRADQRPYSNCFGCGQS